MLYVGIDLHRKMSQLAVVDKEGELVRSRRVRSRPDEVWRVFGELPRDEPVAAMFEATFGYGWLVDLLEDAGIEAHMAHPLATGAIAAGRVTNDKVDASLLAQLLRANLLPDGWIAPLEAREARRIVRTRASLVRMRSRLRSQVHAVLADFALMPDGNELFTKVGLRWLREQPLPAASRQRGEINLRVMESLDGEVRGASGALRERFALDNRVRRLMAIPGIGLFTAATLVAEIWDIKALLLPQTAGLMGWPYPARALQRRASTSGPHLQTRFALGPLCVGRSRVHACPQGHPSSRALQQGAARQGG